MKEGSGAGASVGKKPGIKGVTTTLDFIEFGSENYYEEDKAKTRAERKKLPENMA